MLTKLRSLDFLLLAIFLQVIVWLVIFLDIPVARQALGFVYLTFVPGFAVISLLKLSLDKTELFVYSVGLSIALLMIIGLVLNFVGPLLGILQPLALLPILVVTTIIVTVCAFFGLKNTNISTISLNLKKLFGISVFLSTILILSIAGGLLVNSPSPYNNNILLLVMMISIAILIGMLSFYWGQLKEFYPLILFMVSLALLLHFSLYSKILVGGDIFSEYATFKNTQSYLFWDSTYSTRLSAMLSTTILPTIYSVTLSMNGTWIFKIIYPIIFAFVPLVLYLLFRKRVTKEIAFFSVFFFASNLIFFTELVELPRQMIGELFYVLLFLVIFSKNIKGSSKFILLGMFSFGLVASHYALAYFFLAFIAIVWIISFARKRVTNVTFIFVVLFALLVFMWYIYIASGSTFTNLLHSIFTVRDNFISDFLNPQSRSTQVLAAVGASGITTPWHVLGRYNYFLTEGLIAIGLLILLIKKRLSFFNDIFNILVFSNFLILIACIVVPNLAGTFNITRFYQVALFFLAPLCITGGISLLKMLTRNRIKKKHLGFIVAIVVLIPYFLFQTGVIYETTNEESYSLPLSSYRFSKLTLSEMGVFSEAEYSAAVWLANYKTGNIVYSDMSSLSMIYYASIKNSLTLSVGVPLKSNSFLYLKSINLNPGKLYTSYVQTYFNISQLTPGIDMMNTIYSSGDSVILKNLDNTFNNNSIIA